jgi:hypothetical protein
MDNNNDPSFNEVEDEPTPYGIGAISRSRPPAKKQPGIAFYIYAGGGVVVILALTAILLLHRAPSPQASPAAAGSSTPAADATPAPPATPGITMNVQGSHLFVQWNNLPSNTVNMNRFYAKTEHGTYRLVGTIPVASALNGNGFLNIQGYEGGYYYGVADDGDGAPLWTSSSTPPANGAPSAPPSGSPTSGQGSGNPTNGSTPPENGSSTNSSTTNNSDTNPVSSNNNGTSTTPQENFVVQHFDQKIQISWQSLPVNTSQIVVSRSASDTGPWSPILAETNISTDGPYSILIVDDTLDEPYYYEMEAQDNNSDTISTYGPTLLAPLPM